MVTTALISSPFSNMNLPFHIRKVCVGVGVCLISCHILTWICFDVVHLIEIFRDKKLLK